jgi:serine/threonine-protein kinase
MEYLDGIDLQVLVERSGPLAPGLVAHVLGQVCAALAEAHAVGLIHRDIKPANVILCERGGVPLVAKVLDFGLVKHVGDGDVGAGLSRANTMIGTPLYMAPEAVTNPDRMDARSDLYAVGALGYFLLTGKPVFEGTTVVAVAASHLQVAPVPPSRRLGAPVPADLEELVMACLAKDPAARPASAAELAARLAGTEAGRAWTPEASREAWARCRDLRPPEGGDAAPSPAAGEPVYLTIGTRA